MSCGQIKSDQIYFYHVNEIFIKVVPKLNDNNNVYAAQGDHNAMNVIVTHSYSAGLSWQSLRMPTERSAIVIICIGIKSVCLQSIFKTKSHYKLSNDRTNEDEHNLFGTITPQCNAAAFQWLAGNRSLLKWRSLLATNASCYTYCMRQGRSVGPSMSNQRYSHQWGLYKNREWQHQIWQSRPEKLNLCWSKSWIIVM